MKHCTVLGRRFFPAGVPVLDEKRNDGCSGNCKEKAENGVKEVREAYTDEHGSDDGDGREAHCSFHDERNEEIVLAPLDDVVDTHKNDSPEEAFLGESNQDGGDCGNERADVGDEFREACKHRKGESVRHSEDFEGEEGQESDAEAEEELSARPLSNFPVDRLDFSIDVRAIVRRKEAAEPEAYALFFALDEEGEDEDHNHADEEIHNGTCDACGKDDGALRGDREILAEALKCIGEFIDGEVLEHALCEGREPEVEGFREEGEGNLWMAEEGIHFQTHEERDLLQLGSQDRNEGGEEEQEDEEGEEVVEEHGEAPRYVVGFHPTDTRIDDRGEEECEEDEEELVVDHEEEPCSQGDCKDDAGGLHDALEG